MNSESSIPGDAAYLRLDGENPGLCEECLEIAKVISDSSNWFEEIYTLSMDLKDLVEASCRICRLLGVMLVPDHAQCEEFVFTWLRNHGDSLGTITVQPRYHDSGWGTTALKLDVLDSPDGDIDTVLQCWRPDQVSFERIESWLHNCDYRGRPLHHSQCERESQTVLRALQVLDGHSRRVIAAPENCVFVALSYVWGQSSEAYETRAGLPEQLPQTLEDCITFAALLGYRYIWIDKYCIDQENSVDKHLQIEQMGSIYASADLTIIIASGSGLSSGLPGVSRRRNQIPVYEILGSTILIPRSNTCIDNIRQSAWASRGWTLQEEYFSKRRLYFTEEQVVYVCNADARMEEGGTNILKQVFSTMESSLPHGRGFNKLYRTNIEVAMRLLEEYTNRSLSYESDALNAITGALNTFRLKDPPVYHIWGVPFAKDPRNRHSPKKTLRMQIALHWCHLKPVPRRPDFPSWSPLGWKGPATFQILEETVNTWDCSISVGMNDEFEELELLESMQVDLEVMPTMSRRLLITARVAQLPLVDVGKPGTDIRSGLHVDFAWLTTSPGESKNLDVFIQPLWDSSPPNLNETTSIVCAILNSCESNPLRYHAGYGLGPDCVLILLLQAFESYYERIGYLIYPRGEQNSAGKKFPCQVLMKRGGDYISPDNTWLAQECWDTCEPSWLSQAETKTFSLG